MLDRTRLLFSCSYLWGRWHSGYSITKYNFWRLIIYGKNWKVSLQKYPILADLFIFIGLIVNNSGLIDLAEYNKYVDAFMLILLAGGLVSDSTTQGLSNSTQALTYQINREMR